MEALQPRRQRYNKLPRAEAEAGPTQTSNKVHVPNGEED